MANSDEELLDVCRECFKRRKDRTKHWQFRDTDTYTTSERKQLDQMMPTDEQWEDICELEGRLGEIIKRPGSSREPKKSTRTARNTLSKHLNRNIRLSPGDLGYIYPSYADVGHEQFMCNIWRKIKTIENRIRLESAKAAKAAAKAATKAAKDSKDAPDRELAATAAATAAALGLPAVDPAVTTRCTDRHLCR